MTQTLAAAIRHQRNVGNYFGAASDIFCLLTKLFDHPDPAVADRALANCLRILPVITPGEWLRAAPPA